MIGPFAKLVVFTMMTLCCAQIAHAQEYQLRAATTDAFSDTDVEGLQAFKAFVETESGGAIAVELNIGAGMCLTSHDCLRQLANGNLEIVATTPSAAALDFPFLRVFDLPFLFPDEEVFQAVVSQGYIEVLRDVVLRQAPLRLMTLTSAGGWQGIVNARRRIRAPEDMRGLNIASNGNPIYRRMLTALASTSIDIARPEAGQAFQTGALDGGIFSIHEIVNTGKQMTGLRYATQVGTVYSSKLWLMNDLLFSSMPEDLQQVVVDGFGVMQSRSFLVSGRNAKYAQEEFFDTGGDWYELSLSEYLAFQDAVAPVYVWFSEQSPEAAQAFQVVVEEIAHANTAQ